MKVLLLTDWSYPCDEPFMREVYASRFLDRGHEVVWVMRPGSETPLDDVREHRWNGQPVYVLPEGAYDPVRTTALSIVGRLQHHPVFDIVDSEPGIDLVQVRNDLAMGILASRLAPDRDLPFVYRISHLKAESYPNAVLNPGLTTRIERRTKSVLGRKLRRRIADRADLLLVISEGMADYLDRSSYVTPTEALPMGVNETVGPDDYDPATAKRDANFAPDTSTLFYMGAMSPERNLEFLLDAVRLVADDRDVQLLMTGGRQQQDRDHLRQYSRAIGLTDHVAFEPWLETEAINRRIVAADVGLSPLPPTTVYRASSPTKVLEYLNLGTPAAVTDIPDQRLVVEESGGGLVSSFDRHEYADIIQQLLDDTDAREEMGRRGREYVREHRSYSTLTEQVIATYENHDIV